MREHQLESPRYQETTEIRPRLINCPLVIEESRAYWERAAPGGEQPDAQEVFEKYWFGAKSLPWVKVLTLNLQTRFGAFPEALRVLQSWHTMTPEARALICHWHLQLTDPLYRAFSGDFLIARRDAARPELHSNTIVSWVADNGRPNWTLPTRRKLASRLLSVALSAGLISGRRDPRSLLFPRVGDDALAYLLYALRVVTFEGTLLDNPYLRSVGLEGTALESRLRKLSSLDFQRSGDVVEFNWRYPCLGNWAEAELQNCGLAS
jgi:hypothetical protein